MTKYRPREISETLIKSLKDMPVVVLSGMWQTGKSTLLLNEPKLKKRKYLSFEEKKGDRHIFDFLNCKPNLWF